jgi:cytochrome c-type biogenesis protein CcmH
MLFFWVLAGLLTCSVIAIVVWPLLRRAESGSFDEERRLAVYRDRRAEILREREAGRLTDQEAEQAERELVAEAARQFTEAPPASPAPAGRTARRALWAVIAALAIPLITLPVYQQLGAPALIGLDAATLRGELTPERIARVVAELEQRVARKADDGEGWALLAEALRMQEAHAQAAKAYERASALLPDNARLLTDYAETLVILQRGDFAGRPVQLLEQALRLDPKDGKAIALMGAAQYRLGNLEQALVLLRQLTAGLQDDSPQTRQITGAIARIEAELAERAGRPKTDAPKKGSAALSGSIALDPSLKAGALRGATLFVVARAAEGSRIPIAVLRQPVGDQWPVRFELSDAQAMDPARPLSSADRVVVEARISASGEATRRSGDLFGLSAPLKPGARDVALRIDQRVP